MKYTNQEAEQIILGTALMNNALLLRVADFLEEKHFYFEAHKAIWRKFIEVARNMVANEVTMKEFFANNEELKAVGGINYFSILLNQATGVVDVRDYGYTVVELWQKRGMHELLEKSIAELNDKSFDAVSAEFENEIAGLAIQEPKKKTQHISDMIDEIEADQRAGLSEKFTPTGFGNLDKLLNGGIHNQQLVILGARPSVGKAQPLDSSILTVNGWKKMGNIKIGDNLASVDGKESKVIGVYPQGKKEIFKVSFRDGREVECCKEHLWRVYYRDWDNAKIVNTERLIEMLNCKRYTNRLWIDEFNGDFGEDKLLPIDPWILGVLIGDGGLSGGGITFTNSNQEIIDKLQNKLNNGLLLKKKSLNSTIDYTIIQPNRSNNELTDALRHVNLMGCRSYEKFIPVQYLKSNKRNRLELLKGLLDTDGYVGKCGQISYSTSSSLLADHVISLSRSLGATTFLSKKQPFYNYKGERRQGRDHYTIHISHSKGCNFLTLSSKKDRTRDIKTRQKRNTFSKIEQVGFKEAQCIKVSHKSELYVTNDFIVTHNTTIAQNIILKASKQGKKCLFVSLEVDKKNVTLKFLSNLCSIPAWKIGRNLINQSENKDLNRAKSELRAMGIYTNDSSYLRISQIGQIIKNQIQKQPVDLVVVDYVQIIRGDDTRNKNEALIIKENTTMLKALAKQYDVGILALAQINRKAVEGANQEPTINDFKSSGGIEEDADVAIILHRDRSEEKKESYFSTSGKLIIAKNRHGRTGEVAIDFDGNYGRFNELTNILN